MKTLLKPAIAAAMAMAAVTAAPAGAQVTGKIATVNASEVVIKTSAFQSAYQQIDTTYATQRTTIQQRSQERQTLLAQLDTNSDKRLDDAEQQAAQGTPQFTRIQAIETEVQQLSAQIDRARAYAIEQVLRQYVTALQAVVQAENIQVVLSPDSFVFIQPAAQISDKVVTRLNAAAPTVSFTPPADWQPARETVAIFQEIQQVLLLAQAQRAQAAQQQAAQPAAQPAPSGR